MSSKKLVVTGLLLIVSFSSNALSMWQVADYRYAIMNFHYVPDRLWNENGVVDTQHRSIAASIYRPFYGDCEDFAFSLQKRTGGTVWAVVITEGKYRGQTHAVLVIDGDIKKDGKKYRPVNGFVFDFIQFDKARKILPVSDYPAIWIKPLN